MSTSSVQTAQIIQFPAGGRKALPQRQTAPAPTWRSRRGSPPATHGTTTRRSRMRNATASADAVNVHDRQS